MFSRPSTGSTCAARSCKRVSETTAYLSLCLKIGLHGLILHLNGAIEQEHTWFSLLSCKYEIHQSGVLVCRHLNDSIIFIGADQLWRRTKLAKVGYLFDRLSTESNALCHLPKVKLSVVQKAHPSLITVNCKDLNLYC